MPFQFKTHKMVDGKFGPTPNNHYYQPMPYHNPTATKRPDKTRWVLNASQQYDVFELADTPLDGKDNWMNDDESGLYAMIDSCQTILGKDNGERLAFFPTPQNIAADPWHGYPIDSSNLGDELIDFWFQHQLIDRITYIRLMRHEL